MVMDEGVIKYHCHWIKREPVETFSIADLMKKRDLMHSLGLIGVYENGIGFGNVSQRINNSNQFIISGTQTAHYPTFLPEYLHSKSILPSSNALIELARSSACCIDNSVSVNSSCCWSTFI